ncbi:MAG: porin [Lacipirellulaceae bacterium]
MADATPRALLAAAAAFCVAFGPVVARTAYAQPGPAFLGDWFEAGVGAYDVLPASLADEPQPRLLQPNSAADAGANPLLADPPLAEQVQALQKRLAELEDSLDERDEVEQAKADKKKSDDAKRPTVVWTGQVQADFYAVDQDDANRAAFGDIQNGEAFRRARFGMFGEHGPTEYRIEMDFALAGRPSFLDVWTGIKDLPGLGRVRVGHFFEPFSLERMTPNRFNTFMERSLHDQAFVPARNTGVMANNTWLDGDATWSVGYFRGDSDAFGDDTGDDFQDAVTARATLLPYFDAACGGRRYAHLGFGYSLRAASEDRIRFRAQPEARLGATTPNFPFFADTGNLVADGFQMLGFEGAIVEGPASLDAEYVSVPADLAAGDATFDSFHLTASYFLTGEHRPYRKELGAFDRVQPLRPFVRYAGDSERVCLGPGAWEVAARVSRLDLNEGPVAGGQMDNLTLGLNWYMTPYLRWTANWVHSTTDRAPGGESGADLFGMRVGYEF